MSAGHIKAHRELMNKAFYKDSEKVHLWMHLLFKANWQDKEEMFGGKPIICKAGQFTTGRKQLSIETGINESKVERILTYFEKIEHQIEQQKTSVNRLISIVNWSKYQQSEQRNEQQVNNDRTTSEHTIIIKENKELKEYKKEDVKEQKPKKLTFGTYQNVKLTKEEHERLESEYSKQFIDGLIEWFSAYIAEKGDKSKSHNLTIRRWVIEAYKEKSQIQSQKQVKKSSDLDIINDLFNQFQK